MTADANCEGALSREDAATLIQKTYRGYRTRRELAGFGLSASSRWVNAVRDAQWMQLTRPKSASSQGAEGERPATAGSTQGESSEAARQHWKKAAAILRRAGHNDDSDTPSSTSSSSSSSSSSDNEQDPRLKKQRKKGEKLGNESRMMALQYFLEMVDQKHRYGSNLGVYHEVWKNADTHDNFFHWLDYGEGKDLDIVACPRDRLERERVRYLSLEERQYYLVEIDNEGRLCWAKNGQRIDTSPAYRDSLYGVVPIDDPAPSFRPVTPPEEREAALQRTGTSSTSSAESVEAADRAAKYTTPGFDSAKGPKKLQHLSATTITNRLLRKTVQRNTWIFVTDTNFRLYVGIKDSGSFQHSSFLRGGRIGAAGLIKIKEGRLTALSPLSGHYRPPASNFRTFVGNLREAGVDMKRVSISKSYMVLAGLEMYVRGTKKGKALFRGLVKKQEKMLHPHMGGRRQEAEMDQSESAKREREVVAAEREKEGEEKAEQKAEERKQRASTGAALLERLNISRSPEADKEGEVPRGVEAGATA